MNVSKRRRKAAPEIPWISLADIAWQIVIFFLAASSFVRSDSLNVDLPGSTNDPSAKKGEAINVIAGDNVLQLNGSNVVYEELGDKIKEMLKGKTREDDRAVVVLGRPDLSFQRHVDIMYAIQKAGGILVMSEEKNP